LQVPLSQLAHDTLKTLCHFVLFTHNLSLLLHDQSQSLHMDFWSHWIVP